MKIQTRQGAIFLPCRAFPARYRIVPPLRFRAAPGGTLLPYGRPVDIKERL